MTRKITPFLWFDKDAEQAMAYYVKVFNEAPHSRKNSKVNFIRRYEKGMETPGAAELAGRVLTGEFELDGQTFQALDGGPTFKFNESVSLLVDCRDQEEVDYFWSRLSAVKEAEQCGWCKDKFGLSWQIIPTRLGELTTDPSREKANRVVNAMLKMHKIVIKELEDAYRG